MTLASPPEGPRRPRVLARAVPAALLAAVAIAYSNALHASFQFDDWTAIVGDARVRSLVAWWASLPGIRPLLKLSYTLNHAIGLGALGFHAVNVAIHAGCACLAYSFLLGRARRRGVDSDRAVLAAGIGAAIFALAPVQTEAVTYASGRSASLAALLALASVVVWVEGRARGRAAWVRGLSPVLFAASLGVKETTIVLPAALLVAGDDGERRGRWRDALPHLGIAAAALVLMTASPTYRHLADVSFSTRSVAANLATQSRAVVWLAEQIVRPDLLNADPALPAAARWTWGAAIAAAAIAGAVAWAWRARRARPEAAFGILWFFLWLIPTNSVVPRLDVANDRQVYLALLGPAAIVAWGISCTRAGRRMLAAAFVVLVTALGTATFQRNEVYRSETLFWEDVVAKSPLNARAFNNLGYAYALAARRAEAEQAFVHALALDPGYVQAGVNLRLLREGALTHPPPGP